MRFAAVWFAVVLAGMPVPAMAQEGTGTPRDDVRAREAFEQGREAFSAGRFEAALALFEESYRLSGRPALHYNIATTADRLRRDREALRSFEAYLEALPTAENRGEVEGRITALRTSIAREDALRAQAEAARPEPTVVVATPTQEAPTSSGDLTSEPWFWIAIGVVAVGAGVTIGVLAGSREELAMPTPGDVGQGGFVVALEGP